MRDRNTVTVSGACQVCKRETLRHRLSSTFMRKQVVLHTNGTELQVSEHKQEKKLLCFF